MRAVTIYVHERYVRAFENYINGDRFKKQLKKGIFIMSDMFDEPDDRNKFGKVVDIQQNEDSADEFTLLYHQNEMYEYYSIESVIPMLDVDCTSKGIVVNYDYFPDEENFTINRIVKFLPTFLRSHK